MGRHSPYIISNMISVIVRTYNSAAFVEHALKSIFDQTLPCSFYEIIVVDDGSSDDTKKILARHHGKIRVVFQEHLGAMRALNVGIKNARGNYIILLDSDDTFEPAILEKMRALAALHPDAEFIYCDYYEKAMGAGATKIIPTGDNIFNCVAEGILFRKTLLEEIGLYDESLFFPEYDVLIKIYKNHKGLHIPQPLFTYNRRAGSLTSKKDRVAVGKQELIKKYGDIPEIAQIRNY